MPVLTLRLKNKNLKSYRVQQGKTMIIGSSPDGDVVVRDKFVSPRHAKLESEKDGYYLTDQQSRTGSFVNNQYAISRKLAHGDVIGIGRHRIFFEYDEGEARPEEIEAKSLGKTLAMDTRQHRAKVARSVSKMAVEKPRKTVVGVLSFLTGDEKKINLTRQQYRIGKNVLSDIVIKGFLMGQTAAIISRDGDRYRIRYIEGFRRPKINYVPLKTDVMLNEFDVIEIGSHKMQFSYQSIMLAGGMNVDG